MRFDTKMLKLYAITDNACLHGERLYSAVEEAILGGATCIQLRDKDSGDSELAKKAQKLVSICHSHGVPLIINDDFKTAMKVGADGVHVGQEDASVADIRQIAGSEFIIGATAKTPEQARLAQSEGADYLGVGAVFPSPTKANAVRITPSQLREICTSVSIPAVAIGGIGLDNMWQLRGRRSSGIAVISAIFGSYDIKAAAAALRNKWEKVDSTRTALTIAGSDSSGGAGIQADIKTMQANGIYAMSAITSLTAQNTLGIRSIQNVTPQFLAEQIDAVFTDIRPDAVKIGMIPTAEAAEVVAERLSFYGADNIILDPVNASTSGTVLSTDPVIEAAKALLFPMTRLITPNVPEAELLLGTKITSAEELSAASREISDKLACNVLCKGGHLGGGSITDCLALRGGRDVRFEHERIRTANTHGTGCTLSSAIAACLAKGQTLVEAVYSAENFVRGALSSMIELGHGNGPLDHNFRIMKGE